MKRTALALIGAAALAVPLLGTAPAFAADPPGAPSITNAIPGWGRGEVILDWDAPTINPTGIKGYEIRISSDLGDTWAVPPVNTKAASPTEYTVTNLDPNKSYVFEVRAYNAGTVNQPDGRGDWSDMGPINPVQPGQNVGPPSYVTTSAGERSVTVSWVTVDSAAAYQVQYATSKSGPWSASTSTVDDHKVIDGLTPGTNYYFQVRSYNGPQDYSDWVVTANPTVPSGSPNAPANVQAVAGNSSATVSWSAPSPAPSSYEVQYARTGTSAWSTSIATTSTSATVSGLTNNTSYTFQVRAIRGGVSSAWVASNAVTPVAPQVVPAAPTSVSGYGLDSAAALSWTVLAGQPVTTYEIQYSLNNVNWFPNNPIQTGRTDTAYVLGGLTNGQAYFIRVRASNGTYSSAWTQLAGTVTPASVPGPPQWLTGTPGNSQVTLNWQAPNVVGAMSPVTGYRIQYSSNNGATWAQAPDVYGQATTSTITGLTNGVGYVFRVKATSYAGDGAWSSLTGVITPPGGPSVPTNVVATAGNAQATVQWSPSVASGSPIIGYRVTASPGGAQCTTSAVPPAIPPTTCAVTGLINGTAYTFTVVSVSGSGTSAPSAASSPVTPKASAAIRITDSGRNGGQVYVTGTTAGISSGTALTAMVRSKVGGKFVPTGQVTVQDDGSFSWTSNTSKKVWVKFTGGGAVSNTVVINK